MLPDAAAAERLAAAGIQLLPVDLDKHYIFERDGFLALVERRKDGFGPVGAAGLMTERGLAPLIWKSGSPVFASKAGDQPASEEQVATLRRFQTDLEDSLARRI